MAKKNSFQRNIPVEPMIHILMIALIAVLVINFFLINALSSTISNKIIDVKESLRPGVLELTIINPEDCDECYDINQVVELVKKGKVNISREETLDSVEAADLIKRYNIEKLPTIIIKGETNKTDLSFLSKVDDVYIFTDVPVPNYNIKSDSIVGLVNANIILPSDCNDCFDMSSVIDEFKSNGIKFEIVNKVNEFSAKDLISKYKIDSLPALVLSSDASEYSVLKEQWESFGHVAVDGSYISEGYFPPFKNLTTNMINGLVSLTYLTDNSCKECYDVKTHKKIIDGFNVKVSSETTVDISESNGKELLTRYNITKVPTIIVSSDAKYYKNFIRAFTPVSSKAVDGSFVFVNPEIIGNYKDLKSGEIIKPQS
ncbi:MAG: hypothetical protein AABX19_02250 [Nanoarchaeota archaeon]